MAEKKVSAISSITLNTATFTDESFAPTYINFFYGKNGAGKTSLGRQLGDGAGLTWSRVNLRQTMKFIFTIRIL
jgi:AAA+ superfamily predicted ATPase